MVGPAGEALPTYAHAMNKGPIRESSGSQGGVEDRARQPYHLAGDGIEEHVTRPSAALIREPSHESLREETPQVGHATETLEVQENDVWGPPLSVPNRRTPFYATSMAITTPAGVGGIGYLAGKSGKAYADNPANQVPQYKKANYSVGDGVAGAIFGGGPAGLLAGAALGEAAYQTTRGVAQTINAAARLTHEGQVQYHQWRSNSRSPAPDASNNV